MRLPWNRPGRGRADDGGTPGFREAIRQPMTSAAASALGGHEKVPPGRAERLGLAEVDPSASTAQRMPFEFLRGRLIPGDVCLS